MPWIGTRVPEPQAEPFDVAGWIPLSHLALEGLGNGSTLEARADHLAKELADETVLDDCGRACVRRSVARELFAIREQARQRQAERQQARRTATAEESQRLRDRVRSIQEKQRQRDDGLDGLDMSEAALATMTAAEHAERVRRSSSNLDDFLSGDISYHRIERD